MNELDQEKKDSLKDQPYEDGQRHLMPTQFLNGKWYCYRGVFGWSDGFDTKEDCKTVWVAYAKRLDELHNN